MKVSLKPALASLLIAALAVLAGLVLLVKTSGVEQLVGSYPHYDPLKQEYVLSESKPQDWSEPDEVSKLAKWAVIVSEDWAFYEHPGVDLRQLKKAVMESMRAGELTRGASTITQQVIKNVILSPERSLWRKFKEVVLALYLERIVSKERILEIYLNIIELGDGIYGVSEASRYYFDKAPARLNAREGAFLAMLLPSPVRYATSFYEKELTEYAQTQVDSILIKLRQAGVYDEEERLKQAAKKFYWEKDFYEGQQKPELAPSEYDSFLEESYF